MKKILFLHGFFATGSCPMARALKEAFEGTAVVLTPDLPLHPKEALKEIRSIIDREQPDLLLGNSCGSFLAQMLAPVVGIPALLAVLCVAPAWATALLLAALSVIAAHELLTAVSGPDKARRWTVLPALCGVLLLGRQVFSWPGLEWLLLAAALTLPLSGVLTYGKPQALTFTDVCAMAAAGFAIPWAFSGLYGLRMLEGGYLLVLTPLVAAFCSDALALFTGMALGRHKLAPLVSPHKTVEGAAGGLVGGMAGMAIFCLVYRAITGVNLGLPLCVALGLLGALLGELGDLSFSAVKRQYGIKDYGRLLPGHGGVLDRFDSVLFAAPVLCALLRALAA